MAVGAILAIAQDEGKHEVRPYRFRFCYGFSLVSSGLRPLPPTI